MSLSLPINVCVTHTGGHKHAHLHTPDDVQPAPCLSSRLRHNVQLPPSLPLFLQSSPLLSQAALLPPPPAAVPDWSSISCISPSLIILRATESERVGQPDFEGLVTVRVCVCVCVCVCAYACEQLGTEVGGVYPSEELFPVVVTNRTPAASHYFTAAAISPSVLSEPDTLTCLSLLLSPSLCIFSRAALLSSSSLCHSCGAALCLKGTLACSSPTDSA